MREIIIVFILLALIASVAGIVYYMDESVSDYVYVNSVPDKTCSGVPELNYFNSTFPSDTIVCDFGNCDKFGINFHQTAINMKKRCKELQQKNGYLNTSK